MAKITVLGRFDHRGLSAVEDAEYPLTERGLIAATRRMIDVAAHCRDTWPGTKTEIFWAGLKIQDEHGSYVATGYEDLFMLVDWIRDSRGRGKDGRPRTAREAVEADGLLKKNTAELRRLLKDYLEQEIEASTAAP